MGGLLSAIAGGGIAERSNAMESDARSNLLQQQQQALTQTTPANVAATQAGTQEQLLKNQLLQQQVHDQGVLRDAFIKNPTDPRAVESEFIKNGGSFNGLMSWRQMQNTLASNAAKLTSEQAEARTKVLDLNSGALQKYSQLKPEEQAAAWPQVAAQLNQNEPGAYDPATPLAGNQLQLALGAHNLESKMVAQRAEEAKTAQSNAEAAKLNTERAISERRLAALKDPNTLATLEKQIDASIPLAKGGIYAQQNAVAKQAVAGALATNSEHSLEDAQKAIKDSVDLIGRHDTSIDVAKTELPGKFAEAQALANVHGEIAKAEAGRGLYMKSAEDYSKAQEAAKEMSDVIDLARSGNKVAYAYAPVTGVLTINSANGVKRVNMAEIGKYSGAGNLADRIEGYLGKAISGASIPPQILNDMQQLHQKMLQGPLEKHVRDTNTINQTYNTKFTPQGSSSSQPSGPFKVGDNYNGHKILSVTKVE